jgi:transcriptional regulator with XRE-family HTH domain
MPRKKSPFAPPTRYGANKALVAVRNATGKSQALFAEAVGGITQPTLQRSEEGKRQLTEEEAEAIMAYTGADHLSLMEGQVAKAIDGSEYTKEVFARWSRRWVNPEAVDLAAERLGKFAEALVRASLGEAHEKLEAVGTKPARYRRVVGRLGALLTEMAEEYGLLKKAFDNLMRLGETTERCHLTLREIEDKLGIKHHGGAVLGWNYEEAEKHRSSKRKFDATLTYKPMWNPMTGVKAIGGKRVITDVYLVDRLDMMVELPWYKEGKGLLIALVFRAFLADLSGNHQILKVIPLGTDLRQLARAKGGGMKFNVRHKFLADAASRKRPTSSAQKAT